MSNYTDRFKELVREYADMDIKYPQLRPVTVAQWILESGRGNSDLAIRHFNFGGLKWRKEMQGYATKTWYEASDGGENYCKFQNPEAFLKGYWKFISRPPYAGWENHTETGEKYIDFIGPIYCPSPSYVEKVLNLIPEARQLLQSVKPESEEDNGGMEMKKLCALVIGHKRTSPGAVNARDNLSEFQFNNRLAALIEEKVVDVDVQRVYRRTYNELPGDINALGPDFIVSLHCNAFNQSTSGTEVLYHHRSSKGKKIARILQKRLVDFLKLRDRGIKWKTSEDQGGYLLNYTEAPCVIAEPFFIDNNDDLDRVQQDLDGLAHAYANAIYEMSKVV